jgi:inhibitor of KinA
MNRYSIFPLGDSAITIDLGNYIDEERNIKTLAIQEWLRRHSFPGLLDIIMAYSSVSVFYDPAEVVAGGCAPAGGIYPWLAGLLKRAWEEAGEAPRSMGEEGRLFEIPVCYEAPYGPDLQWVAEQKGLTPSTVIELHTAMVYRVYMIGFLPGFPYLGTLDRRLEIPRKPQPVRVPAGGVGIAGMQTGIYPLNSPGGWQIIGRTPVALFDPHAESPTRLQAGDRVRFFAIPAKEFTC